MPLVVVSEYVKIILDRIKVRDDHQSYESVIRALLYRTNEIDGKEVK